MKKVLDATTEKISKVDGIGDGTARRISIAVNEQQDLYGNVERLPWL